MTIKTLPVMIHTLLKITFACFYILSCKFFHQMLSFENDKYIDRVWLKTVRYVGRVVRHPSIK